MAERLPPAVQRLADQGVRLGLSVKGHGTADHGNMVICAGQQTEELWVFWYPPQQAGRRRSHRVTTAVYDPLHLTVRRSTTRAITHKAASALLARLARAAHLAA